MCMNMFKITITTKQNQTKPKSVRFCFEFPVDITIMALYVKNTIQTYLPNLYICMNMF